MRTDRLIAAVIARTAGTVFVVPVLAYFVCVALLHPVRTWRELRAALSRPWGDT